MEFFVKLMSQEKSILNDGKDCFVANLTKVRLKARNEKMTRSINKFVDPIISCFAIIFLGMFIFVFLFLLITFWNVEPVVSVGADHHDSSSTMAAGARAVASYLKVGSSSSSTLEVKPTTNDMVPDHT